MTPGTPDICRVLDRVIDVAAWPLLILVFVAIIYFAVQIFQFHRTLHKLCGLAEIPPTTTDCRTWEDFLREMEPLNATEQGGFSVSDLTAVLAHMKEQKRAGIPWSMRPSTILRDPEKFRDLVLEVRSKMSLKNRWDKRPAPQPIHQYLANGTNRITDELGPDGDAVSVGDEAATTFADMRRKAGL
jgi:hypothetical protein